MNNDYYERNRISRRIAGQPLADWEQAECEAYIQRRKAYWVEISWVMDNVNLHGLPLAEGLKQVAELKKKFGM